MFKLTAPLKDYIWGGNNLKEKYGKVSAGIVAESWELSTHPDGESIVSGGPFNGIKLSDVLKEHPEYCRLGASSFDTLPILFKLIDSSSPLSVQVHPDDLYARKTENSLGKTECWYILDATEDSFIYLGLNSDITKESFAQRIRDGSVESVLNRIPVHPGEIYYIPSGIVHAIGKGVTLAELQQSSNITYRVYDYNRLGKDGKPRQLHIEKALDVIRFRKEIPSVPTDNYIQKDANASVRNILKTDLFYLDRMELTGNTVLSLANYFRALSCICGSVTISNDCTTLTAVKGNTVFLPAGNDFRITGNASILLYGTDR